jgi:hypothetical protein
MTPEPFISGDVEELHHSGPRPAASCVDRRLVTSTVTSPPAVSYHAPSSLRRPHVTQFASTGYSHRSFYSHPTNGHDGQHETQTAALQAENARLKEQLRGVTEESKGKETAAARARAKEAASKVSREDRDSSKTTSATSMDNLSAAQATLPDRQRQQGVDTTMLQAENARLQEEIRLMKDERTAKETAAARIRAKEKEWTADRDGEILALRREVEEWKGKHAAFEETLERVCKERDEYREECRKGELAKSTIQHQLDASEKKGEALATERDSLKTFLETTADALSAARTALDDIRRRQVETQREQDRFVHQVTGNTIELQSHLVALRKDNDSLKQRDLDATARNADLVVRLLSAETTLKEERAEHAKVVGAARTVLDALERAKKGEKDARHEKGEVESVVAQRNVALKEAGRSALSMYEEVEKLRRDKRCGECNAMNS